VVTASVLIVDDDAAFREIAAELLRARGFSVIGRACDHDEAISQANRLRPDAVLLDVHMGTSDALALTTRLIELDRNQRVLLTSSDPGAVTVDLVHRCGAIGFIAKADLVETDLDDYLCR
jgi:DNA-binding NarL/FixJ family response regulator